MIDFEKNKDQIPELEEGKNILGKWASFFIHRYRIVYLIIAAIFVWGIGEFISLPRELSPEIVLPYGQVLTTYVGAAPEEIEKLITDKIEKKMDELENVKKITSTSGYGYSSVFVEFEHGTDMDDAQQKMKDKISSIQSELPKDAEDPDVISLETNNSPIMIINVSGDYDFVTLKNLTEKIQDEIEKMKEISDVLLIGGLEREIKIIVDPQKLSAYNISLDEIKRAIDASNVNFPGGNVELEDKNYNIRTVGEFKDVKEIENIAITYIGSSPLLLKDLAQVEDGYKDAESYSRMSYGLKSDHPSVKKAVALSIKKKETADIIKTSEKIHDLIQNGKGSLYPEDLQVEISGDTAEFVEDSLGTVVNNAKGGLLLVIIVLFLFIGLGESLVVSLVIPLSILITFGFMGIAGMTFNTMSLFSLVLAVGMLVDNGIVIMENIDRLRFKGLPAKLAAEVGTNQIAPAIAASTLTTLAAFFPILLTPGIMGSFIKTIPKTVMFALSASFIVAITITPALCGIVLKKHRSEEKIKKHPAMEKILKISSIVLVFALSMYAFKEEGTNGFGILSILLAMIFSIGMGIKHFGKKKESKESLIIKTYGAFLYHILGSKWKRLMVIGITIISLVLSILLIPLGILKVEMFSQEDYERLYINIETPKGTNLDTTSAIAQEVEQRLFQFPEIETFVSNVGITGADSFDNMGVGSGGTPNMARIIIDLSDKEERERSSMTLAKIMRNRIKDIPGAKITVEELKDGPPTGSPISIRIVGENLEELKRIAGDFEEILKKINGTIDVKNSIEEGAPEIQVKVNKERAVYFGLNDQMIAMSVRNAVHGVKGTIFRSNQDEIDVMIRTSKDQLNAIEDLEKIYFYSKFNQPIPFSQVAKLVETKSISSIGHEDLKRRVNVSSNLKAGMIPMEVTKEFKEAIKKYSLPEGVRIEYGGEEESTKESFTDMFKNMIIAAILVFIILAVQFNSLSQPFIILFAVPMALIGVMPGLVITGNHFGFLAFLGVVALVGIAVNDAIVLVDYINYLRKNGYELKEAVKETGMTRFVPVMATTITTIGGILPMTLKQSFYGQMGYALIFGLGMATILTLIVVPVLYSLLEEYKSKRKLKKTILCKE
ncbi:efflux RND transporter permease subunit [Crassaminicella profunda]|uniref:efflux RND transporter permease subunit n=1 Tax=Crassaminicella profunda TaxID=1286698 RepID=UPI001CA782FE|nr:efflux RND transporter permease subunit [Crassaminicella profunda]QZY55736.1 efflux RND transporter permease subunit [Crassaminicella profunda]